MRPLFILLMTILTLYSCQSSGSRNRVTDNSAKVPEAISQMGKQVFISTCATCHKDSAGSLAPAPDLLGGMSARSVLAALDKGKMRLQAEKLTEDQRSAVAQYITNKVLKENSIPKEIYTTFSIAEQRNKQYDQSGWGGNPEGTGYRTAAQADINTSNIGKLKLKWAFAFPDATQTRSKPALIGDWLFMGSEFGEVYAINTQTGRPAWNFTANAAIRGGSA